MLVRKALCLFLFFCAVSASAESVYDLLNPNAQNALTRAQVRARELRAPRVTQAHMLWALLQDDQTEVSQAIKQAGGVDVELLKSSVDRLMRDLPKTNDTGLPPLGDDLSSFLRRNCRNAHADLGDVKIPSEAVLYSMIESGNPEIRDAFSTAKLEKLEFMNAALAQRGLVGGKPLSSAEKTALHEFGVDLTEVARRKGFRPIVGMKHEIDSIKRKFDGPGRKAVALVGRSGSGKTKVLEEIARLTALPVEQQPEVFRNKRLVIIDMNGLMSNASHHGQAEGRIKAVLEAAKKPVNGVETMLVLDNFKQPPKDKAGSADFASVLAREIDNVPGVFLTCEEDTWHNYVQGQTDLGKKMSDVRLISPEKEATYRILKDHRPALERGYGVTISNEALESTIDLAKRFMGEKSEPMRSLDLLREVCASYRQNLTEQPPQVDLIDEKIINLETTIEFWENKGSSSLAAAKIKILEQELQALRDKRNSDLGRYEMARKLKMEHDALSDYVRQLETYLKFAEREKVTPPINRPEVEALLSAKREELRRSAATLAPYQKEYTNLSPAIQKEHVAQVVSREKKVPVGQMMEDVKTRLLELDKFLDANLIGQQEAKEAIKNAVYRYYTEIRDPNKPYVVRFKGVTGVGKTEMAKLLAQFLFGDKDNMKRLDMTQYSERHTVSRLFGSPVGYEGHYEGGELTNHVMKNPFTIVLLDETEKAARQVLTAFLQPFDEGKGSDSVGRRVDYSNVIFIQTDNALDDSVFPPEYLNRIQDTIVFKPLTVEELKQVYDLRLKPVQDRIFDKLGISIIVPDEIKMHMAAEAAQSYGARQVANIIEHYIVNNVAKSYVHDEYHAGDEVTIMKDPASNDFFGRITGRNSCAGATSAMAN